MSTARRRYIARLTQASESGPRPVTVASRVRSHQFEGSEPGGGEQMAVEVTVGIDIGTTSVKALAVDGDGRVVASSRVGHELLSLARRRAGPPRRRGLARRRARGAGPCCRRAPRSPSSTSGRSTWPPWCRRCARSTAAAARSRRAALRRRPGRRAAPARPPADGSSDELVRFLAWLARAHPDAAGLLAGAGGGQRRARRRRRHRHRRRLHDHAAVRPARVGRGGRRRCRRRRHRSAAGDRVGCRRRSARVDVRPAGPCSGAGRSTRSASSWSRAPTGDGDVLVILGSTLIVWAVVPGWPEVDGLWTVPHTATGHRADRRPVERRGPVRELGRPRRSASTSGRACAMPEDPGRVPVWQPYLRGERVPFHDPARRASLHDLDIGMDAARDRPGRPRGVGVRGAPQLDLAGLEPRRGSWRPAAASTTRRGCRRWPTPPGCRSTWSRSPRAAALGRGVAGPPGGRSRDDPAPMPRRWVRTDHRVEPDRRWSRRPPTATPATGSWPDERIASTDRDRACDR